MSAPRWARRLLARIAPPDRANDVVGDLEEVHRHRMRRHSRVVAGVLSALDALDMAQALLRERRRARSGVHPGTRSGRRPRDLFVASWLDLKLSLRLHARYPGLTAVSVLGLTVGVTIGAVAFGMIRGVVASRLALDEGDRLVTVQHTRDFGLSQAAETHLHALDTWRTQVPAFAEVGAYRPVLRNLIGTDGDVAPGRVAEMTASGFRIARVPPLLGRYLVDEDEMPGAPDVVVIGHGVWQDRFGGDPVVVGRSIQIGATIHTVVGVMPPDFAFPVNDRVWTPLRLRAADFAPGDAPAVNVFARLAPGATLDAANVQLRSMAGRGLDDLRRDGATFRPAAFPYTQERFWGTAGWLLYAVQIVVSMVLVVIAINVSALVYARTVSRASEIAVRTALGASRSRIVAQLFVEALLLSSAAATIGLIVAGRLLEQIEIDVHGGGASPFWWDFSLSLETIGYALALAVLAATIIGVVPALGATGRGLGAQLQRAGAGTSAPRLGRTWASLIVLQVAAAVAVLPVAVSGVVRFVGAEPRDTALPLEQLVIARVELDHDPRPLSLDGGAPGAEARYAVLVDELTRRIEARPEVARVARMGTPPWLDPDLHFEVEGSAAPGIAGTPGATESASTGHRLGRSTVGPEIFAVMDVPVLEGRTLTPADAVAGAHNMVVNETFVHLVMGGAPAVGSRIRFPVFTNPEPGRRSELDGTGQPWYTVVGVVPSFPPHSGIANPEAKAYLPLRPGHDDPLTLAIRVRPDAVGAFTGQLRALAVEIDPMLRLSDLETLRTRADRGVSGTPMILASIVGLAGATLLLAIAGLYALMSFTVSRQHREIGIRIALGARQTRLLGHVLLEAGAQLTLGVVLGLAAGEVLDRLLGGEMLGGTESVLLPGVAVLMMAVAAGAAWGPARRALRIQPTEVLKAE